MIVIYRLSIFQTQGKAPAPFLQSLDRVRPVPARSTWFFAAFPEKVLRDPIVFLKNPVKGGLPRFAMLPIFRRGDMSQFVREYFNACRNGDFSGYLHNGRRSIFRKGCYPASRAAASVFYLRHKIGRIFPFGVKVLEGQRNQRERIVCKGDTSRPAPAVNISSRRVDMGGFCCIRA